MMNIDFVRPPNKMLIIKPSSLGDIIHSLPFLGVVKRRFPNTEIHWVVARGLHVLLENHPLISKLWIINKDSWKTPAYFSKTLGEIRDLYTGLGREGYDVCVDLSGLFRSGLLSFASKAPVKIGFANSDEGSPFFYTHKVQGNMELHAIDRYLQIAAAMGCPVNNVDYPMAGFEPDPSICRTLPNEYAVIAPSAGKEANRWPARRFGELAARLPLPTVIVCGKNDAAIAEEVAAAAKGKAISLAGKTNLTELLAVIRKARFFISNDTGPMHIAAAFHVPVFALFGPANPKRTGPYGKIHTIIKKDIACAPCYRWKPCEHWRCMEDLTVDEVLAIIEQALHQGT
jgi:lipopolysaccharide heptosyltransferase I